MPRSEFAGSRIRDRRMGLKMRQADLARDVGISPAYLNLIEHNRRRIGGKLLNEIAARLGVEPAQISEGAGGVMLDALKSAAASAPDAGAELDRIAELAERLPGWARTLIALHRRNADQRRQIEALSDRMTHDPQLATSLHEILSVVTAIRATSGILKDGEAIDPGWLARFHRNLYEDSQRLAEGAQALVAYLDTTEKREGGAEQVFPQEELEFWLAEQAFHLAALERPDGTVEKIMAENPDLSASPVLAALAGDFLARYRADALQLPSDDLARELADGADPLEIAERSDLPFSLVLRRIATLAPETGPEAGLVVCDSSGTISFRRPIEGFPVPLFGSACALWPLFQALSQPLRPLRFVVEQAGHSPRRFLTYAIAEPLNKSGFGAPQVHEATMLILPEDSGAATPGQVVPVGPSCRICPRADCEVRREPSILSAGG